MKALPMNDLSWDFHSLLGENARNISSLRLNKNLKRTYCTVQQGVCGDREALRGGSLVRKLRGLWEQWGLLCGHFRCQILRSVLCACAHFGTCSGVRSLGCSLLVVDRRGIELYITISPEIIRMAVRKETMQNCGNLCKVRFFPFVTWSVRRFEEVCVQAPNFFLATCFNEAWQFHARSIVLWDSKIARLIRGRQLILRYLMQWKLGKIENFQSERSCVVLIQTLPLMKDVSLTVVVTYCD